MTKAKQRSYWYYFLAFASGFVPLSKQKLPPPFPSSGFDPSLFHDEDGRKWLVNMLWGRAAYPTAQTSLISVPGFINHLENPSAGFICRVTGPPSHSVPVVARNV